MEEVKKVFTINIKPSVMKDFDKKAKDNKRSRSSEMELAIENYLKEKGGK